MPNLLLLRGLPGAGKTTLACSLGGVVFSADDFFYQPSPAGWQYQFDAALIKQAHNQCMRNTEIALRWNMPLIIVANTFAQAWELQPYLAMAQRYGATCHSLIVENRHQGRSVHDVPDDVMAIMAQRFEIKLRADAKRYCSVCEAVPLRHNNKSGVCSRCQQYKRKRVA